MGKSTPNSGVLLDDFGEFWRTKKSDGSEEWLVTVNVGIGRYASAK
jgi:hypothetical protein